MTPRKVLHDSPVLLDASKKNYGQQQEVLVVTVDDYNYEQGLGTAATTAPIFQQHTECQDKVIVT